MLIKKLQEWLKKVKWFTKLDIQKKYYKICIKKKKEWKTVFWTRYELYKYQIMLFKLINTSAMFQELINHVLYDHLNKFVIAYLNNILIYFKNEKNHKKHIKEVLRRFQEKNLYFKSEKCKFHKQWVEYLKHIVTTEELKMNSEKIKTVIEFLTSECVKNIQAF